MSKFIIYATSTFEYKVPVEAEDEEQAIEQLDDWIASDFADYQVYAGWNYEVVED